MSVTDVSGLSQLGTKVDTPESPEKAILEKVPNGNAGTDYVVRFTAPEFTSLCPMTGQPDFAHIVIDYIAGDFLVESKSLKLYLGAFRNHGAFHEDCTLDIGKRLMAQLLAQTEGRSQMLTATEAGRPLYEKVGFAACGSVRQHLDGRLLLPDGQPLAFDLGVDEHREQIVGGVGPAILDDIHRESGICRKGFHELLDRRLVQVRGQPRHQLIGPVEQHLALFGHHTEHVADDGHGQRSRQIADEVGLALLTDVVDEGVTQPTDGRHLVHDALASEAGVDELAPHQVCRIVHVDHVGHARLVGADAAGVGEQFGVALGVEHGLVRGHRGMPGAVPEHRLVGPHPPVRLVCGRAVGIEPAVGQVNVGAGDNTGHLIS